MNISLLKGVGPKTLKKFTDNNINSKARELKEEELEMVTGGIGLKDFGVRLYVDDQKKKTDEDANMKALKERSNRPITIKA